MKKFLPFLLFSLLLLQSTSYSQSPIIQTIIDQTNLDSLITFVEELSGEVSTIIGGTPYTILSRNKNQPGNDKAADYIQQNLNTTDWTYITSHSARLDEMYTEFNPVRIIQTKNI